MGDVTNILTKSGAIPAQTTTQLADWLVEVAQSIRDGERGEVSEIVVIMNRPEGVIVRTNGGTSYMKFHALGLIELSKQWMFDNW
jgi:hypothetical protein